MGIIKIKMKFLFLLQSVLLVFAETLNRSEYIQPDINKKEVIIPRPKNGLRVTIFGDSISEETWGPILSNLTNNNTGIQTQFQFLDYAQGGVTLMEPPDKFVEYMGKIVRQWNPYKDSIKWNQGKNSEPDIAILMIGSNDYRQNVFEFKDNSKEKWRHEYEQFVQKIKNFKSQPQVYLMNTPPILASCCELDDKVLHLANKAKAHIAEDILNPMVQEIAEEYGVNFLNLNAFLGGKDLQRQQVLCEEQPIFPICNTDHYAYPRIAQFVFDNVIETTDAKLQLEKEGAQPQAMSQITSSSVTKTGLQKTIGPQFRQK